MINPTEYVPKSYHARVSTYWWLTRWVYLKFILREVSSVFVAWFVVVTLLQIRAVTSGPADYGEFQRWLRSPLLLTLNAVSFFFVVFHAVTWFNLSAKAMVVRVGGKRLPGIAIAAPNYAAWAVASGAVAWILLRG
ncbi:MAG: fumarate reductase subunit C [Acidobacteria bacterium]|nr:fumarate reductase subunit C [Acidobacteriota bacterium]